MRKPFRFSDEKRLHEISQEYYAKEISALGARIAVLEEEKLAIKESRRKCIIAGNLLPSVTIKFGETEREIEIPEQYRRYYKRGKIVRVALEA